MQVWKSKFVFTLLLASSCSSLTHLNAPRVMLLWSLMAAWRSSNLKCCRKASTSHVNAGFPSIMGRMAKKKWYRLKGPTTDGILNQWQGWPLVQGKEFWIFNIPLVRKKEAYSWPPSERFWSLCSTAISPNFTTIARSLSTVKSPLSIVFSCSKPQDKVVPSNKTIWVQWFWRVSRLFLISSKTSNLLLCLFVVRLPRVFLVTCLVTPAIAWGTWTVTLSWSIPELDMFESFKKEGVSQVRLCLSHNCSFHVLCTKCQHHLWTYH